MTRTVLAAALWAAFLLPATAEPGDPRDFWQAPASHYTKQHTSRVSADRGNCPARKWCGCWLANYFGMRDRALWLARKWASIGRPAGGPGQGVVVVWPHHVGVITGKSETGWIVKSGNDGNAVRERERSLKGVIAFRHVQ